MMDAAGRCVGQLLDAAVGHPRGEDPVVPHLEFAARHQGEGDQYAVLERKLDARGRNGDAIGARRGVEILERRAIGAAHEARLVPAADAGVALGRGAALGVDREEPGGKRILEQDGAGRGIDAVAGADAPQQAGPAVQLMPVVQDLDPFPGMESQHLVASDAVHHQAVAALDLADRADDGGVVARPFEGGRAQRPAVMDLDPVELVLQPLVARGRRHQTGIGIARDIAGQGREAGARGTDHRRPARRPRHRAWRRWRCRYC